MCCVCKVFQVGGVSVQTTERIIAGPANDPDLRRTKGEGSTSQTSNAGQQNPLRGAQL